MRVLVVDTYYPAFLATHYGERPRLAERSYAEQLGSLLERCFGTFDAYSHWLRALGHEAEEVVVNAPELQVRWAREHGVRLAHPLVAAQGLPGRAGAAARYALLHLVARAQIEEFRPDVVYAQDLWFFSRRELDALRGRGILVVGQIASQPPGPEILCGFDLILTSFPHYVERFRELGVDSEYLKIAFDPRILERLSELGVETAPDSLRPDPLVFVGGINPRVHAQGTRLLERICERKDVAVWGYGVEELPEGSAIRRCWRGEAWGLEMYSALANAQVVLNRHIDAAEGHANNMRLYEATGAGAALLTDPGSNLAELFEPGREVAVYRDEDDLLARTSSLLADAGERLGIACAGQERTLREHTYDRRIAEAAQMLETRL